MALVGTALLGNNPTISAEPILGNLPSENGGNNDSFLSKLGIKESTRSRTTRDSKEGCFNFSQDSYDIKQSDGVAIIQVDRTCDSSGSFAGSCPEISLSSCDSSGMMCNNLNWDNGDQSSKEFQIYTSRYGVGDKTDYLTLSNNGAELCGKTTATLNIIDDRKIEFVGSVDQDVDYVYQVTEGDGYANISVQRTGCNNGSPPVSVKVGYECTTDGTGCVNALWVQGECGSKELQIPIADDHIVNGNRYLDLEIHSEYGEINTGYSSLLQILDNDNTTIGFSTDYYGTADIGSTKIVEVIRTPKNGNPECLNTPPASVFLAHNQVIDGCTTNSSGHCGENVSWGYGECGSKTIDVPVQSEVGSNIELILSEPEHQGNNPTELDYKKNYASFSVGSLPFPPPEPKYPPVAKFTYTQIPDKFAPSTINLDGSDSSDSDGNIDSYEWKINGQTLYGKKASIELTVSGEYQTTLTVTDDDGLKSEKYTKTVEVEEERIIIPPIADFIVQSTSTLDGNSCKSTIELDANKSHDDSEIVSYNWKFNDGSEELNGVIAERTLIDEPGSISITLTVKDDEGQTDSKDVKVQVDECPDDDGGGEPDGSKIEVTFEGLKEHYSVGETLKMDLITEVAVNKYVRPDLWVAIAKPTITLADGTDYTTFLFKTKDPFEPWSPIPQAYKSSIERLQDKNHVFDFEVPEGFGGDYTFYAAYIREGQNPINYDEGLTPIISDLPKATQHIILSNIGDIGVPPSEIGEDATIKFNELKRSYNVGDRFKLRLLESVGRDEYTRVDLWVAVKKPDGTFLFRTEDPFISWNSVPQAHKFSIENTQSNHYIFDFEVPEGIGGDYEFYAAYVDEGENPLENGFYLRSNLEDKVVTFANRKD